MAQFIAVANMKGGVGKTATVISLAETLAALSIERSTKTGIRPKNVLAVDLDAQASASFALAGDMKLASLIRRSRTLDGFLERFLVKGEELSLTSLVAPSISDVTHQGVPLRIGLLASSPRLRTVERNLIHSLTRHGYSLERVEHDIYQLLSEKLRDLGTDFDYMIFDCPPGISILTEVALRMSDLTIVPTVPDFLSLLGLDAFTQTVWNRLGSTSPDLPAPNRPPYVLITKRRDLPAHDRSVNELRNRSAQGRADYRVFMTEIPEADGVPDALERVTTHPNYAQKWNGHLRSRLVDLASEINIVLEVT